MLLDVNKFQAKLKIVTVFGAGLLVGTALTVIIPEGIRALYSDVIEKMHNHKVIEKVAGGTATPESHEEADVEHSSTIGLSLVLGELFSSSILKLYLLFKVSLWVVSYCNNHFTLLCCRIGRHTLSVCVVQVKVNIFDQSISLLQAMKNNLVKKHTHFAQ